MDGYIKPTVYVVTVCFNSGDTIGDTFASIRSQINDVGHYYVIDGLSSDDTVAQVQAFQNEYPDKVTIISEADSGIYDAMNKGVTMALVAASSRDLIGILNSDDWYSTEALSLVRERATAMSHIDIFHGNVQFVNDDKEPQGHPLRGARRPSKGLFRYDFPMWHPTMFVRADTYKDIGLYDTKYKIAADFDWAFRALEKKAEFYYIDQTLVHFRLGGISTSNTQLSQDEANEIRRAHGFKNWHLMAVRVELVLRKAMYQIGKVLGIVNAIRWVRARLVHRR